MKKITIYKKPCWTLWPNFAILVAFSLWRRTNSSSIFAHSSHRTSLTSHPQRCGLPVSYYHMLNRIKASSSQRMRCVDRVDGAICGSCATRCAYLSPLSSIYALFFIINNSRVFSIGMASIFRRKGSHILYAITLAFFFFSHFVVIFRSASSVSLGYREQSRPLFNSASFTLNDPLLRYSLQVILR